MKKHILFFVLVFTMAIAIAFLFGKKSIVGKAIVKIGVDISAKKPENVPLQELEDRIVGVMRTYDYNNFAEGEVDSIDKILFEMNSKEMDSAAFMNYLMKIDQYIDTVDYSKKSEEK